MGGLFSLAILFLAEKDEKIIKNKFLIRMFKRLPYEANANVIRDLGFHPKLKWQYQSFFCKIRCSGQN